MGNKIAPHYTIVELDQGSREWLEWRHKGIGASDAPTIMGENPWKNVLDLLREKCGPARDSEKNAAMIRGTLLEPEARRRYAARTRNDVRPACLQSNQYTWMRASIDGISPDGNVIVEIKCGESVYRRTSQNRCIPDYYYGQLQHIMAVSGLASLDFWCYLPGRPELLIPVHRDDKYIERLIASEKNFWNNVQKSSTLTTCEPQGKKVTNGTKSSGATMEFPVTDLHYEKQSSADMPIDPSVSKVNPQQNRIRKACMILLGAFIAFPAIYILLTGKKLNSAGWIILVLGGYIVYRQLKKDN